MEEAELLKERLLAITDKRKLQEEIAQRRLKIEEEKIKLHHLQKKSLRERWLLEGLSALTPAEQEETIKQNQGDQEEMRLLDGHIGRLEEEIVDLEKQESQLSAREVRVLQRLKSVEKTTEDIIKAVKAEVREEPAKDIYADIPDLPPSYKPSFIRRMESAQAESGEEARKALFAMEIKVEKDMKTGKNTVISSIPVPSDEITDAGVKVYDDGRKSVYAVSSGGKMVRNGVDSLAPIEVEDLLRKATERSTHSPTEYHQPVFSNPYHTAATHKGQVSPRLNGSPNIMSQQNGDNVTEEVTKPSASQDPRPAPRFITQNGQRTNVEAQHDAISRDDLTKYNRTADDLTKYPHTAEDITKYQDTADDLTKYPHTADDLTKYPHTANDLTKYPHTADDLTKYNHNADDLTKYNHNADDLTKYPHTADDLTKYNHTADYLTKYNHTADDLTKYNHTADDLTKYPHTADDLTKYPPTTDDIHYNILHAAPCYVEDGEPVTMIFMGYKHADENDHRLLTDYEGLIRAELVVIEDEEEKKEDVKASKELIKAPETQPLHLSHPPIPTNPIPKTSAHSPQPYKNSISLREQDATLGPHNYLPVSRQSLDDGTEDPSLTALRIRMAKLGKKVI